IEKNRSKNDGRVILASLTPQGKEKAKILKQKVNEYYKEIIDAIPEGEVLEVVSSVNTLLTALKEVRPMCC
ncbi:MAG: MarR family winged helix-turn-helix transcriptional regulator, partial [Halanaerobiales bacterium]|nr:MarR family winged helix-turn-helix transcriptional regulator [Halanaerobiales bacterium]